MPLNKTVFAFVSILVLLLFPGRMAGAAPWWQNNNPVGGTCQFDQTTQEVVAGIQRDLAAIQPDEQDLKLALLRTLAGYYSLYSCVEEALNTYQQALTVAQKADKQADQIDIHRYLADIYSNQKHYEAALNHYQLALSLAQELNDPLQKAYALYYLGSLYGKQGQYEEAVKFFQQVLVLVPSVDNPNEKMSLLSQISGFYESWGYQEESFKILQQELTLARETNDRQTEAYVLNNLAGNYTGQDHYGTALDFQQQALAIHRETGNQYGVALTLESIGFIYQLQGRHEEALEIYQQALDIYRILDNSEALTPNLLNFIGTVYEAQGHYEKALETYQTALQLNQKFNPSIVGRGMGFLITNNMARVHKFLGNYDQSLKLYRQVLPYYQDQGFADMVGDLLNDMGEVYAAQQNYSEALDFYQQALTTQRETSNRVGEATTLYNMGKIYETRQQFDQALETYQQAIAIVETIRSTAGSEQGRASFIAKYASLYNAAINLLYRRGQKDVAFFLIERSRARAFLDALATGHVQLTDSEASQLIAQEQETYRRGQAIRKKLDEADNSNSPDFTVISALEAQLAKVEADHAKVQSVIEARDDQLASLIPGRSAQNVLPMTEVQTLLDPQTILLAYYTLEDKTLAFIITSNNFQVIELALPREELTNQVGYFRELISLQEMDVTRLAAQELYQALITPLANHLTSPRLLIVPHGPLHYLPFAALLNPDSNQYLLQQHEIIILPSASALPFIQTTKTTADRRPPTAATEESPVSSPLIVGNPAVGDFDAIASLATERDQLGRLPFAEQEATKIAALYGVEPLIGEAATEGAVRERAAGSNLIHLATHGYYNPSAPLNSLIALAPDPHLPTPDTSPLFYDGWLTVGEVYGLDLKRVDLVVLSACETQLGQLSEGDDVIGLTRALFFAGTPTVVASLWSVDDQATGLLMEQFYTQLKAGLGKAAALRQAQLEVLQQEQYADPFYWAAFVISGDGGKIGPDFD